MRLVRCVVWCAALASLAPGAGAAAGPAADLARGLAPGAAEAAAAGQPARSRYAFWRAGAGGGGGGGAGGGARRVFGGASADLAVFPAVCALLDRYWATRCSCALLAERWALTAAHCVSTRVAYVAGNTRRPAAPDGDVAPVHYLYRHPGYRVVQEDEGRGLDVTLLHHDVGLVRARRALALRAPPPRPALPALRLYDAADLAGEDVQVLGFGRTEAGARGEELFAVRLRLVRCARGAWLHCVCGAAAAPGGVCSGDSGGPVLYRGAQIGVTSMGPVECAAGGAAAGATSVFTSLYPYADVINATVGAAESALRMRMLQAAGGRGPLALLAPAAAAVACGDTLCLVMAALFESLSRRCSSSNVELQS